MFTFLLMIILTQAAHADCSSSYRKEDLEMLKAGSSPPALHQCVGRGCICADKCPYPVNTDGVKMCDIIGSELVLNSIKDSQVKAEKAAAIRERLATKSVVDGYKTRIKNGENLNNEELNALVRSTLLLEAQ